MGMKIMSGEKATRTLESIKKSQLVNLTFFITESGYATQTQFDDSFVMIVGELENRDEIKEKLSTISALYAKQLGAIVDEVINQAEKIMEKDIENRKKSVS